MPHVNSERLNANVNVFTVDDYEFMMPSDDVSLQLPACHGCRILRRVRIVIQFARALRPSEKQNKKGFPLKFR